MSAPPKFCSECGARGTAGKFCSECGTRYPEAAAAAAAAAPAQPSWQQATAQAQAVDWQQAATQAKQVDWQKTAAQANTAVSVMNRVNAFNANQNQSQSQPAPSSAGGAQPSWQQTAAQANSAVSVMNRVNSFNANNNSNNNQNTPAPAPAATRGTPVYPPAAPATAASTTAPAPAWSSNVYKPAPAAVPMATAAPAVVPPAATGLDAQECYEACVATIRDAKGGNNEQGVRTFKQNCKSYGLNQMSVQTFYASLVAELGPDATRTFVPTLARLVPDDNLRKQLIEHNAQQVPVATTVGRSDSFSSTDSNGPPLGPNGQPVPLRQSSSKGILKGRYADHPNCDVCFTQFDVTKRRHQCRNCGIYVCGSCSPLRLLIPPGQEIEGAKGYDPSVPQRVCLHCAPQLHGVQDQLVSQYAKSNDENVHEAKGRIHVPFSDSLMKECRNAADIIGNFFRNDWGASADRSIPVAFLQKAHGLAVMTIIKAGFMVTGKIGTGLVISKLPDGSWSAPSAIGTIGLGGGFEIGGEIVEVMIILGSEGAVKVFHKPQVNLGAGLDLAVGPYGRSAEVAAAASTSGLNANYSYSQSKGLYAGISLQGAVIAARGDLNRKFYGRELPPADILSGIVEQPRAAQPLYEAIDKAMQGIQEHKDEIQRRSSLMGACRVCSCPMFVAHQHQVWNKNCKTCKHLH